MLNASRLSAALPERQVAAYAEVTERTALIQAEAVQEAAAVLATFRSISGETFMHTLRLGQDFGAPERFDTDQMDLTIETHAVGSRGQIPVVEIRA